MENQNHQSEDEEPQVPMELLEFGGPSGTGTGEENASSSSKSQQLTPSHPQSQSPKLEEGGRDNNIMEIDQEEEDENVAKVEGEIRDGGGWLEEEVQKLLDSDSDDDTDSNCSYSSDDGSFYDVEDAEVPLDSEDEEDEEDRGGVEAFSLLIRGIFHAALACNGQTSREQMDGPVKLGVFIKAYRSLLKSLLRTESFVMSVVNVTTTDAADAEPSINIEELVKEYEVEGNFDNPVTVRVFIHLIGTYIKLLVKLESYLVNQEKAIEDRKSMEIIFHEFSSPEQMDKHMPGTMFLRVFKLILDALGKLNDGMGNLDKGQSNKASPPRLDKTGITYNWPLEMMQDFYDQEEHLKKLKKQKHLQGPNLSNGSSKDDYDNLVEFITSRDGYTDHTVEGMIMKLLSAIFELQLQQSFVFKKGSSKQTIGQMSFQGTGTSGLVLDCVTSKHAGADLNFIRENIQKFWILKKDRIRNFMANNDDDDEEEDSD